MDFELIVQVVNDQQNEQVVGTGFFLTQTIVCTCAHVVETSIGQNELASSEKPHQRIPIKRNSEADVLYGSVVLWNKDKDIALIELQEQIPSTVLSATENIERNDQLWDLSCCTYGFPEGHRNGVTSLDNQVRAPQGDYTWLIEATERTRFKIKKGFSGAPVFTHPQNGQVIGMIKDHANNDTAWMIPINAILDSLVELVKPEMILIPSDVFFMENENGTIGKQPLDTVYYIAKYPITVTEYWSFVQATGHRWKVDAEFIHSHANHPATHISWNDAQAYCVWMSRITGVKYKLPEVIHWVKAARGGIKINETSGGDPQRKYPWGNEDPDPNINHVNCHYMKQSTVRLQEDILHTCDVTQHSPQGDSPYEIADLLGNVWELCDPQNTTERIPIKGGSFRQRASEVAISKTYHVTGTDYSAPIIGFRPIAVAKF